MTEFNPLSLTVNPNQRKFDPLAGAYAVPTTSVLQENRNRYLLPIITDKTKEEVDFLIDNGNISAPQNQALGDAEIARRNHVEQRLDQFMQEDTSYEDAVVELTEVISSDPFASRFIDPSIAATVLNSDDPLARRTFFNRLERVAMLQESMAKAMESASSDNFWTNLDFVDVVASSAPVYGNIITNNRIEAADRLIALVNSSLPPEEFQSEVDSILSEIAAQGVLTDDNRFLLEDLFALLPAGSNSEAASQRAWATFDTVASLTGLGALRNGVRSAEGVAKSTFETAEDAATLVARVREEPSEVRDLIVRAADEDNPVSSPVNPVNHMPSSVTPISQRVTRITAPEHQAISSLVEENEVLMRVRAVRGATAFDDEGIEALRTQLTAEARQGNRRVMDNDLFVDDADNIMYTERLGTSRGGYFATEQGAQRLAQQVGGVVTDLGESRYVVDLEANVPLSTDLFTATDVSDLGLGFWARFGSPGSQTTERLQSILLQTESIRSKIHDDLRNIMAKMDKSVSSSSKDALQRIRTSLRDDPRKSGRMEEYTRGEFIDEFREANGRSPTKAEEDYYNFLVEMDVTSWYITADSLFKEAAARGERILKIGDESRNVILRSPDDLEDFEMLYDLDTGKLRKADTLTEKQNIFTMADRLFEVEDGVFVQHVVSRNPKTRRLYHSDVLPYNAGGRRSYVDNSTKIFVKQESTQKLVDGTEVSAVPKTALGVKIPEEAATAVKELNNIIDEISPRLGKGSHYDQVRAMDDIDDVIRRNNTWNPSVTNKDELVDFFADYNLSFSRKFDQAADGDALSAGGARFLPGINDSTSYRELFRVKGNPRNGRRDRPLTSFGGDSAPVRPVIESSKENVVRTTAQRSEAAYVMSSVNGLVRAIDRMETLRATDKSLPRGLKGQYTLEDLNGLTIRGKLARLIDQDMIDTSTVAGKRLALEAKKIDFRLRQQPIYAQGLARLKNSLSDSLYGSGWTKTSSWMDQYSLDPITAMRSAAFQVFMGLGNIYQFILQSSQVISSTAIAGPRAAVGFAVYPVTRLLVGNGNEAVIKSFGRTLKPITGLTEDQFFEMVDMLRSDGRMVTSISVAELGEDAADVTGAGLWRSVKDIGLTPFREGELAARITAHNAAYMNYIKKFPDSSPRSTAGRRWIAREQDRYTHAMTSASRSPLQEMPFAQFLSYPWRVSEALMAGSLGGKRILSTKEKLSMATTHIAMFGAAGLGAGSIVDRLSAEKHLDGLTDKEYNFLRYGLLDAMLSQLVGTETALSDNLAYGQGVADLLSNTIDSNFLAVVAGPSGVVADTFVDHVANLVASLKTGSGDLVQQDFMTLARQLKSVDMAHNAYTAVTLGHYFSRNGRRLIDDDVDIHETIALAFGIPIAEYQEAYALRNVMYNHSQYEQQMAQRIERLFVGQLRAVEEGDMDAANTFQKQIAAVLLSVHENSPIQAQRIIDQMATDPNSYLDQTMVRAIQRDLTNRGE